MVSGEFFGFILDFFGFRASGRSRKEERKKCRKKQLGREAGGKQERQGETLA